MKEDFLQTIWQLQRFMLPLQTSKGLEIQVLKPGIRNRDDGPDFRQARLMMDGLEWNGSVEVHVRSREWRLHGHDRDSAYDSVILHVVWEEDEEAFRKDGTRIPALELKNRIPLETLLQYRQLLNRKEKIPCAGILNKSDRLVVESMLELALVQRLERRGRDLLGLHQKCGFDWMRTAALALARCLGMKGNEEAMEYLIHCLPPQWLHHLSGQERSLREFFLGIAGMEEKEPDAGGIGIFSVLKTGLQLQAGLMNWKKRGMRPAAFPKQRIRLLARWLGFLQEWLRTDSEKDFVSFLTDNGEKVSPALGMHVRINFQAVWSMARGLQQENPDCGFLIAEQLQAIPAEDNRIVRELASAGFSLESSAQSQGAKELHDNWCLQKKCMECRIGLSLLSGRITSME